MPSSRKEGCPRLRNVTRWGVPVLSLPDEVIAYSSIILFTVAFQYGSYLIAGEAERQLRIDASRKVLAALRPREFSENFDEARKFA